jgi:hypothetical protein
MSLILICALSYAGAQSYQGRIDLLVATAGLVEAPDAFRAAQALQASSKGLACRHLILETATLKASSDIAERLLAHVQAAQPKALIVSPAPKGTAAAFFKLKAADPSLVLIAICPEDPPLELEAASDLVLDLDWAGRAVLVAKLAAQYGIREIVQAEASSGKGSRGASAFSTVLAAAAQEAGLTLMSLPSAKAPADFLEERAAALSGKVLFWPGDLKDLSPVLERLLKRGGYMAEQIQPSLSRDYPALLGLEAPSNDGDYRKTLKQAERNIIETGAAGRFGVWQIPGAWVLTKAAADATGTALEQRSKLNDLSFLRERIARNMDGVKFKLSARVDASTGVRSRNHFLFMEDIYMLGKGIFPVGQDDLPLRYRLLVRD